MNTVKIFFFVLVFMGCSTSTKDSETVSEINALMAKQENAWNEGDIDGFMKSYWQNDSLMFIGSRGASYGWQKVLNNYKSAYPDRATMGRLQFNNIKHKSLGRDYHWVAGEWTLFRAQDTLGGNYTLVWKKINGAWLIVSDHSS